MVQQQSRQRFKWGVHAATDLIRRQIGSGSARKPGAGEEEQPLRAELYSIRQLEQHAKTLAAWHEVHTSRRIKDQLLPRLRYNEVVLADTHHLISDVVARGRGITPAQEWFLDNYYLIE